MNGRMYDSLIFDEARRLDEKLWLDSAGRCRLSPCIVYEHGEARLVVRTKYASGYGTKWKPTYYPLTKVPADKHQRNEMLRNVALMHAMKLGVPHRLRSKKL